MNSSERRQDARLSACDRNYWHASNAFLASSKTGTAQDVDDLLLTHCGFPQTGLNMAFVKQPEFELAEAVARALAFFEDVDLPFHFECRLEEVELCESAFRAAGFERIADTPAMVLAEIPGSAPPTPSDVEIVRVAEPADLADFQATAFAGFGFPEAAGALFLTDALGAHADIEFLLAKVEGEAAATSCLIATEETAGIYWVATREAYRRRGLGEAVTWAAALAGSRRGCAFASLQASEMGRPVYTRMGFANPTGYAKFERPVAS